MSIEEKILKTAAAAYILNKDFKTRVNLMSQDYRLAYFTKNKKERYIKLCRLRDEVNGYFIHIYQVALSGIKLYKKEKKVIKDLKSLNEILLFDSSSNVLNTNTYSIENSLEQLKHFRDHSAHPKYYQLNIRLFNKSEEIEHILYKVYKKLYKLAYELMNENEKFKEIFIREVASQKVWLVNRSRSISHMLSSNTDAKVL